MTALAQKKATEYAAFGHQHEALSSEKSLVLLAGGVGSGKTDGGSMWTLRQIMRTPEDSIGIIAANTYDQLIQATLRNLFKNFRALRIPFKPASLPVSSRPIVLRVWNGSSWIEVLCRSLENFGALSGIEVAWFWLDEVWATPRDAYDLIIGRARDSKFEPEPQGLLTTTTDEPTSWVYREFIEGFDPERMKVIHATSFDNPMLPATYLRNLKASYSPKLYKRMVLAHWVSLESGHIYHSFTRNAHAGSVALDPEKPVWWCWDFNIAQGKPMSSVLMQPVTITVGRERVRACQAFSEIVVDSTDTHEAIDEFEERFLDQLPEGKDQVTIYGDAAGRSRDTRSKTTDYGILRTRGYRQQKVPRANPAIRTRHNVVNSVLMNAEGTSRFLADAESCKTLLRGLETVKLRKGASYLELDSYEQHVTTALGYCLCQEFPLPGKSVQGLRLAI